jgi:predicted RNA-binding protein (virulence factor B family)
MIKIGKQQKLKVMRFAEQGLYLVDDENDEVLLPNRYITDNMPVYAEVDVFIYKDSEDRLVATTESPKIKLNDFAILKVNDTAPFGAFLDWGLQKDLLVPNNQQAQEMQVGKSYLVYMYIDDETDRLVASSKVNQFLNNDELTVNEGDEVDLIIANQSSLGTNTIINKQHKGLLYHNEVFTKIKQGDRLKGYIKKIREDHKIDVSLQKQGYINIEPNSALILEKLKENTGFLDLNDKSDPEQIKSQLGISKKTFKKAIGALYKQKLIKFDDGGVRLV